MILADLTGSKVAAGVGKGGEGIMWPIEREGRWDGESRWGEGGAKEGKKGGVVKRGEAEMRERVCHTETERGVRRREGEGRRKLQSITKSLCGDHESLSMKTQLNLFAMEIKGRVNSD